MAVAMICELDEAEMTVICGGQVSYEKGTGDASVSCCSWSFFGVEFSIDLGTVNVELNSDYAAQEGARQQEIGTTQAGR
ncbi:hypothetical protein [Qipengyuania sp. 902]|uniref:hypothetical protein n=1 Tax=Qipengyuania sp. 902 TaxID=3417565 RepID=UPI003EB7F026